MALGQSVRFGRLVLWSLGFRASARAISASGKSESSLEAGSHPGY